MAYLQLDISVAGDPRVSALAEYLDIPEDHALGKYVSLLCWAGRYAMDGNLSGFTAKQLAAVVHSTGDAQEIVRALVESGLVAGKLRKNLRIVDWPEIGAYFRKLHADRERKRHAAAALPGVEQPWNSGGIPPEIHRNGAGNPLERRRNSAPRAEQSRAEQKEQMRAASKAHARQSTAAPSTDGLGSVAAAAACNNAVVAQDDAPASTTTLVLATEADETGTRDQPSLQDRATTGETYRDFEIAPVDSIEGADVQQACRMLLERRGETVDPDWVLARAHHYRLDRIARLVDEMLSKLGADKIHNVYNVLESWFRQEQLIRTEQVNRRQRSPDSPRQPRRELYPARDAERRRAESRAALEKCRAERRATEQAPAASPAPAPTMTPAPAAAASLPPPAAPAVATTLVPEQTALDRLHEAEQRDEQRRQERRAADAKVLSLVTRVADPPLDPATR